MVLGLLELVLLGLVLAVIASQLWSVSARQTLFVAVGSMGAAEADAFAGRPTATKHSLED